MVKHEIYNTISTNAKIVFQTINGGFKARITYDCNLIINAITNMLISVLTSIVKL